MSPCGARITVTYEGREYLFRLARVVQLRSLRDFYYGRAARGNFSPGAKKGGRYRAIRLLSMGYTRVMSRLPTRGRSRVIRNG